ncbi:TIGR03086 family metal-binding protein [Amycolatopsis sp. NPDC059021]|uniref:TIGR03086 family metal-binding protein n=1 Tax=Amycolatopsis sp. NPDC059021 TaxID=3346704 RepID=UPI00366E1BE8
MNPLDAFDRASAAVTELVSAVRDDQWALPTACAEWDVRALVNHLAHGNAKVAHWAGQGPPAEPGDYLGERPEEAFAESVRRVRAVLATPGLLDQEVDTPLGKATGTFLVHMRVNEYLAHGWDLADATGRSTDLLPELAEQALSQWQERFSAAPRGPGAPFGPEVEPAPGATAADRLAAFLGRRPVRA